LILRKKPEQIIVCGFARNTKSQQYLPHFFYRKHSSERAWNCAAASLQLLESCHWWSLLTLTSRPF